MSRLDLEELERSLRAVDAVGSVVHALHALARAQLPRAEAAVADTAAYLDWVDEVVQLVAGPPAAADAGQRLLVLLGPERPFSGTLSARLAQTLSRVAMATERLGVVGRWMADVLGRDPALCSRALFRLAGPSSADELSSVAETLAGALLQHARDRPVRLVYPGAAGPEFVQRDILATHRSEPDADVELYSPPHTVLKAALSDAVVGRLRCVLAEAHLAEIRARLAASERARQAIDDRRDNLRGMLRVRRQERITQELIELVAGMDA